MSKETKIIEENESIFSVLSKIDCSKYIEKKKTGKKVNVGGKWIDQELSYISFPAAWGMLKEMFPDSTFVVENYKHPKTGNDVPYLYDEQLGYMVKTTVKINDVSYSCTLPVLDSRNEAMKDREYSYKTKDGRDITIKAADFFDINTAIQRCLVKNIAYHGLGISIYLGEDLPVDFDASNRIESVKNEDGAERLELIKKINDMLIEVDQKALFDANKEVTEKIIIASSKDFDGWKKEQILGAINWIIDNKG